MLLKQSSVHFSPKKKPIYYYYILGKKENIIKNTTATEKEELKLKKHNKIHIKVSDRDQVVDRF